MTEDATFWRMEAERHAPAPLGTIGQNTISRAELGAYGRRHGWGRDTAGAVADDIVAHRETGVPAEAPPPVAASAADAEPAAPDDTSRVLPASPEKAQGRAGAKDGSDRAETDAATAATLITAALLAELGRRLAGYENAITWNTSCLSCASRLDFSYAETVRREQAESRIADLENTVGQGIREAESMLRAMTEGREAGPEWVRRILYALGAQDQDRTDEKGPDRA